MTIAEILRIRRKALGWTQAQLAEKVGVSVKTISNWETGRTLPDISSVIQLSHLYDLSLDNLLTEGSDLVIDMQEKETLVREATWGMLGPSLTNLVLMLMLFAPFFFKSFQLSDPMLLLLVLAIFGNSVSTQYFIRRRNAAPVTLPRVWRWLKWGYIGIFALVGIAVLVRRTMIGW